ncbi:hypothetical protein NQZ68_039450 [Dissostichus eleginoides]|nr:hypothetical protein NQZ68_039450 [Dissostichus eleginoides]
MKPVLETLVGRGHQVKVLIPSTSMFMNSSEPSRFGYEPFNVSVSKENIEALMEEFLHFSVYEMDHMSYLQIYIRFIDLMRVNMQNSLKMLDGVLKSETIMKKLKEGKYDLLLADPVYPGSDLLAEILGIPLVYSLHFSIAHNWERYCGQLPAPPSFVPGAMSKLTDNMDFSERVWNFLYYALQDTDMEEFVQSSGDAGIVVFTLGSFIKNITTEKGNMIASALAKIPQKVLLVVMLYSHSKTRAFITHGGTNGIYEAIYHGVPMVGLPLFGDQPENMVHMKAKGAALSVDLNFMKTEDLRDALRDVIKEKSYKENAMRLSSIFHDRPMNPRD